MLSNSRSNGGKESLIPDELFKADQLRQQHKVQRLEKINLVADLTAKGGGFEVAPTHVELLFGMTTESMINNGLIDPGTTHVVYDTGEQRTVTDIFLKAREVKERILEDLNADSGGDWAGNFDKREQAVEWLTKAADRFEEQLRLIDNNEEIANG